MFTNWMEIDKKRKDKELSVNTNDPMTSHEEINCKINC